MNNTINGSLVNVDNSQYSGSAFTSRVIPSTVNPNVMPEPLTKGEAANSFIPCSSGGKGRRKIKVNSSSKKIYKKKINNIANMYKMRGKKSKTRIQSLKKSIRSRFLKRRNKTKTNKTRSNKRRGSMKRGMKGGYSQYQNNQPMTQTYSLGGNLSPNESALANPPIYKTLSNCTNCVDNYSYFKNSGFPSRGWH